MIDQWGRKINYLRISVTDKCNLRCSYCMPEEGLKFISEDNILTKDEIMRVVKSAAELGVTRVRITGGEPLMRKDIIDIVKGIKVVRGIKEVNMTTNGILLSKHIRELVEAGLDGINISLDTLRPEVYKTLTRGGDLSNVLEAIELSLKNNLKVKLNAVIIKGINEEDIFNLAEIAEEKNVAVRFIELMPIGQGKKNIGLSSEEVKSIITSRKVLLSLVSSSEQSGPAIYYKTKIGRGRIGFISSMSHSFCSSCNRIRITAEGFLKYCIHWNHGTDLKALLRREISDEELRNIIADGIFNKPKEHRFKVNNLDSDTRYMYQIGG